MAAYLDLTTDEPGSTQYRPHALHLLYDADNSRYTVEIVVRSDTGKKLSFAYGGAEAQTMIEQLNTADLSTVSLWYRILDRLATDGHIVGSVIA